MKVILYELDGQLMTPEEFRKKMFRSKPNRSWNNQGSYKRALGQFINTLREEWFADINKDGPRPKGTRYPLITWSGVYD